MRKRTPTKRGIRTDISFIRHGQAARFPPPSDDPCRDLPKTPAEDPCRRPAEDPCRRPAEDLPTPFENPSRRPPEDLPTPPMEPQPCRMPNAPQMPTHARIPERLPNACRTPDKRPHTPIYKGFQPIPDRHQTTPERLPNACRTTAERLPNDHQQPHKISLPTWNPYRCTPTLAKFRPSLPC